MPGPEPPVVGGLPSRDASVDGQTNGSSVRRAILLRLRRAGAASPDELASALRLSRTGILQQLRTLESANLVSRTTVRHGVGRPRHMYDVTPDAQDLFPANYDGLAAGLLSAIVMVGGDTLLDDVLAARRRQLGTRLQARLADRLEPSAPVTARARELAVFQDEQGYLCDTSIDADGTIRLREHNCAIYRAASVEPAACAAELELFSEVLGAEVVRETHIMAGDRCCTYRIGRPQPGVAAEADTTP